ncbi:LysR family transcriptional regulator [Nostocoides sp. F2B08]|uniref:LysR family transcriptional regulator n=1 Tax=Nostocoides sp. F2B08 TaxID=2653936 RepID=UPI001263AE34|nr:LysR family transcriptional regulator [Tetrasphaera sp. F2B08]KAB7741902.1 LysR family transcriptional regulator [Tetrasphaera sp. F2B08]
MDWSLRELRHFVTAADLGSFTDAARELHVSQAAVSRTIASLERAVGDRVLRRIPRGCEPTPTGAQILPHARRVLAEADRFSDFLRSRHSTLRLGYAWAGLGRHTAALQRTWARDHTDIELELVKRNTPTAGLAEGTCDVAILRRAVDDPRLQSVVVGLERRVVAFASDDPLWARRRSLSMAELAERTVLIDSRTGSTTGEMWADLPTRPTFVESGDVDQWLDSIAAGKAVGTTAEATAHHHVRPGVTYRPVKDGPRIPVRLVWWREDRPRGLAELVDVVTRLYAGSS